MVALQFYVHFCYTTKWISSMFPYIPSLLALPPTALPHPNPLGHHRARSRVPCARQHVPTGYRLYPWWCVYVKRISQLTPTPHVRTSFLYVCISIPALQIVSSLPVFLIPRINVNIQYLFFSFWLTSLCVVILFFLIILDFHFASSEKIKPNSGDWSGPNRCAWRTRSLALCAFSWIPLSHQRWALSCHMPLF